MIAAKKISGPDFAVKFGKEKFSENKLAYIIYENDLETAFCIYEILENTGNISKIIIHNTSDVAECDVLFDLLVRSVMNDMELSGADTVTANENVLNGEFMVKSAEKTGFILHNGVYKMKLTGFFDQKCKGCSGDCDKCEK